jgi:hypothetical protein
MCKYVIAYLFYASMTVLDEWGLISGSGRNFYLHCNLEIESGPDSLSYPTHDGIFFHLWLGSDHFFAHPVHVSMH